MKKIISLFVILIAQFFYCQLDKIHYVQPFVFSDYRTTDSATLDYENIYLSAPLSSGNVTIKITLADGSTPPKLRFWTVNTDNTMSHVVDGTITISNQVSYRFRFDGPGSNPATLLPGDTPTARPLTDAGKILGANIGGLILTSDKEFYVNYRAMSPQQAGSSMSKGSHALGKEFFWGGTPTELPTTIEKVGSMASMMATENNTIITISNIDPGTEFINGSLSTPITGTTITRTLHKGQSFILYAPIKVKTAENPTTIQGTGWLGAHIVSDKNIVVTVGGLMQQGNDEDGRDFALDQLIPVEQLGYEHIVMKGNGVDSEKVVVIATRNNTVLHLNGDTTPTYTLPNQGDYVIIPYTKFIDGSMYIKSNQGIYVYHKIFGGTKYNTNSFMLIPPLTCFGPKSVDNIPDTDAIGSAGNSISHYADTQLAVLAAAGSVNIPLVRINGTETIHAINGTQASIVPGNPNWVVYRYNIGSFKPLDKATYKNITVTSAGTVQVQVFGSDGDNAGFGGYYSGFGTTPVTKITSNTSTVCIKQALLSTTPSLGVYQWYRDGNIIKDAISATYQFTIDDSYPAEYTVIITAPGGCTIPSEKIQSVLCPCTKEGSVGTPEVTKVGISTKDKHSTVNWPTDVNNGFIALDSNDKGFVITRMTDPETSITKPINGMLVYDTDDKCLKLYDGSRWICINQTCN